MSKKQPPKISIEPYLTRPPIPDESWFDPMLIAIRLMRVDNVVIDKELATKLQFMYEEIAHRYMDMSALLGAYIQNCDKKDGL